MKKSPVFCERASYQTKSNQLSKPVSYRWNRYPSFIMNILLKLHNWCASCLNLVCHSSDFNDINCLKKENQDLENRIAELLNTIRSLKKENPTNVIGFVKLKKFPMNVKELHASHQFDILDKMNKKAKSVNITFYK